jgi:alpha-galactosidase
MQMKMTVIGSLLLCAAMTNAAAAAATDPLAPTGRWSAYNTGHADTPPMGWSSWNAFGTDIDEAKIIGAAQRIVDSGLAAKGYRYVNIDDGWITRRAMPSGRMIIRADRFPSSVINGASSFRPLTDKLHAMGLKAGIYSDLGRNTCSQAYSTDATDLPKGSVLEREVGLYGHIDQDIALYFASRSTVAACARSAPAAPRSRRASTAHCRRCWTCNRSPVPISAR